MAPSAARVKRFLHAVSPVRIVNENPPGVAGAGHRRGVTTTRKKTESGLGVRVAHGWVCLNNTRIHGITSAYFEITSAEKCLFHGQRCPSLTRREGGEFPSRDTRIQSGATAPPDTRQKSKIRRHTTWAYAFGGAAKTPSVYNAVPSNIKVERGGLVANLVRGFAYDTRCMQPCSQRAMVSRRRRNTYSVKRPWHGQRQQDRHPLLWPSCSESTKRILGGIRCDRAET